MRGSAVGTAFSLARQGLELGIEYGPHSLEALLWVAETIEESVYCAGSLARDGDGIRFSLHNPPLRAGAFSSVRLLVDGRPVAPDRLRLRTGMRGAWRSAGSVTPAAPIDLRAGVPVEFVAGLPPPAPGSSATVRLELECPAIPPLVWVEFRDAVR